MTWWSRHETRDVFVACAQRDSPCPCPRFVFRARPLEECTTVFILLCNQSWGQGGTNRKAVAPGGMKGAKKGGVSKTLSLTRRGFLPDVQGRCRSPPGTWESRHMPLPFLIRRLLFVVAEKLPVHLTSSASRWNRHA